MKPRTGRGRGIVIDVTEEVITLATSRDSSHCVIADALKISVPEASHVSVDLQTIRWTDRAAGLRYIYLTPAVAQVDLVNFDQGLRPEPHQFRLGRPAQIMKTNKNGTKAKPTATQDKARRHLPSGVKKRVEGENGTGGTGGVPTVLGGDYPPTAALSSTRGRRRAFGLRSLKA